MVELAPRERLEQSQGPGAEDSLIRPNEKGTDEKCSINEGKKSNKCGCFMKLPCCKCCASKKDKKPEKTDYEENFKDKKNLGQKVFAKLQNFSNSTNKILMVCLPLIMSWIDLFSKAYVVREQLTMLEDVNYAAVGMLCMYLFLERILVASYIAGAYYKRGPPKSWQRFFHMAFALVAQFFGLLILYETWETLLVSSVKEKLLKRKKKKEEERNSIWRNEPQEYGKQRIDLHDNKEAARAELLNSGDVIQTELLIEEKNEMKLQEMNVKIKILKKKKLQLSFFAHRILYLQVLCETIPLFLNQIFYYFIIASDDECTTEDGGPCVSTVNMYISVIVIGYGLYENDRYKFNDANPGAHEKSKCAQVTRLYARLYEVISRVFVFCIYFRNIYNVAGGITIGTLITMLVPVVFMELILLHMFLIEWNDHCIAEVQKEDNIVDHFLRFAPNLIYLADINMPSVVRWHSSVRFYETFYVTVLGITLVVLSIAYSKGGYTANSFNNALVIPLIGGFLMYLKFWWMLNIVLAPRIKYMEFKSNRELHNTILRRSNRHTRSLALKSPRSKLYELDFQKMNPLHCAAIVCDRNTFVLILSRLKAKGKQRDRRLESLRHKVINTGETVLHIAARRLPKSDIHVDPKTLSELTRLKANVENLMKTLNSKTANINESEVRYDVRQEEKVESTMRTEIAETSESDDIKHEYDELRKEFQVQARSFLLSDNNFNIIELIMEKYSSHVNPDTNEKYLDDIEDNVGRRALVACDDDYHTLFHKSAMLGNHLAFKKLLHWTKMNYKVPRKLRDQDIALIDGEGNTCLHWAVLSSKTQLFKCHGNHQLSEKNLEHVMALKGKKKKPSYKCKVCDTVAVDKGIVWNCPQLQCTHSICDNCYMKSKKAVEEELKKLGSNQSEVSSLFSREVVTLIAEEMTLPQLLIPNNDKMTAFDLAVEKGKSKSAYWLRDILDRKLKKLRNKKHEQGRRDFEKLLAFEDQWREDFAKFLSFDEIGLDGLNESFRKAMEKEMENKNVSSANSFSPLFEGWYKDVRKKLKKALRVYWGGYAKKKRKTKTKGYLYYYVGYFSDGLQATKYLYDKDEAEYGGQILLDVHNKLREEDMLARHDFASRQEPMANYSKSFKSGVFTKSALELGSLI